MSRGDAVASGRTVLVVGNGDIARACARAISERGGSVVLASPSGGTQAADSGATPHARLDATRRPVLTEELRRLLSPRLDGVVLAYGPGARTDPAAVDPDGLRRLLDVHALGTSALLQELHPLLRGDDRSAVLVVSSRVLDRPTAQWAAYGAAKAAQEHLVLAAGDAWSAHGIGVGALRAPAVRGSLTSRLLSADELAGVATDPWAVAEAAWVELDALWRGATGRVATVARPDEQTERDGPSRPMRVSVLGPAGSGKTTAARLLAARLDVPVHHLDAVRWTPRWTKRPDAEWHRLHASLVAPQGWVLDGNYTSTLAARLARSDAVVLLQTPTWRCVGRVARRELARAGGRRDPDLPPVARSRPDMALRKATYLRRRELRELAAHLRAAPTVPVLTVRRPDDLEEVAIELVRRSRAPRAGTPAPTHHHSREEAPT